MVDYIISSQWYFTKSQFEIYSSSCDLTLKIKAKQKSRNVKTVEGQCIPKVFQGQVQIFSSSSETTTVCSLLQHAIVVLFRAVSRLSSSTSTISSADSESTREQYQVFKSSFGIQKKRSFGRKFLKDEIDEDTDSWLAHHWKV